MGDLNKVPEILARSLKNQLRQHEDLTSARVSISLCRRRFREQKSNSATADFAYAQNARENHTEAGDVANNATRRELKQNPQPLP